MTAGEAMLLTAAAVVGGALNAIAGGGSFFTFPALVFVGIPAIPANATSSLALWPGAVASVAAYRRELRGSRLRLAWFGTTSLIGGALGAVILVFTPAAAFDRALPFLLLLATVLFALGPKVTRKLRSGLEPAEAPLAVAVPVQFAISVYGGYFGGGMGMMMLAAFSLLGMRDIHRMNGLKTVLAVAINAAALVPFIWAGIIVWTEGLLMIAGAIAGGYGGAALARRLDPRWVRGVITLTGGALTVAFFVRGYLR